MQIVNAAAGRRFTLLDAIIVVAAIAVALLPAAELWPDVAPVAQRLEVSRIFEPRYVQEELFGGHMRSGRMATVRIQMAQMVNMALGLPSWRDTYIDYNTRKPAPEKWVQNWVVTHAPPGALGFALAQDAFWLFFPFLFVGSFCLLCLRLVRPRVPWSAVARQPGWWASVGSIGGVMLGHAQEHFIGFAAPSVVVPATVVVAWVCAGPEPEMAGRAVVDRSRGAGSGRPVARHDSHLRDRLRLELKYLHAKPRDRHICASPPERNSPVQPVRRDPFNRQCRPRACLQAYTFLPTHCTFDKRRLRNSVAGT